MTEEWLRAAGVHMALLFDLWPTEEHNYRERLLVLFTALKEADGFGQQVCVQLVVYFGWPYLHRIWAVKKTQMSLMEHSEIKNKPMPRSCVILDLKLFYLFVCWRYFACQSSELLKLQWAARVWPELMPITDPNLPSYSWLNGQFLQYNCFSVFLFIESKTNIRPLQALRCIVHPDLKSRLHCEFCTF